VTARSPGGRSRDGVEVGLGQRLELVHAGSGEAVTGNRLLQGQVTKVVGATMPILDDAAGVSVGRSTI
jgi:hypothetical protein